MIEPVHVELGEVRETLLIPLYGWATETQNNGLISDLKAVQIVKQLDYDFTLVKNKPILKGAALRTLAYDPLLLELLEKNNRAAVIELGCGMNTLTIVYIVQVLPALIGIYPMFMPFGKNSLQNLTEEHSCRTLLLVALIRKWLINIYFMCMNLEVNRYV